LEQDRGPVGAHRGAFLDLFVNTLPSAAAQAVVTIHRAAGLLQPGAALAVLALYALVTLELASIRVAHQDA
jgi:hypothetical protein